MVAAKGDVGGAPIGWDGKTVLEMLEESERLFQETGRYQGIDQLELKEGDHFRYERAFAKLRGALVAARETALHISASPIVRNIGELCFALYTPEGDSVAVSTGIMVHVHTMSEALKWMVRNNYERDPGIRPGDIFTSNDPDVGNVHTADVHTMVPIFWEDELVGWASGVTHQVDIGANTPGHDPITPTSRFEDGFHLTCERIGEDEHIRQDHRLRSQRAVRSPLYWDLDEKCRATGAYLIRDAVHRFIAEEGIDYYKRFTREVVEEGRRIFMARVRERLLPGRYRVVTFVGIPFKEEAWQPRARKDFICHAPMEIVIGRDGDFFLSMEGASAPGFHAFNCAEGPMQGAIWVLLSQMLVYDGKLNDGSYLALRHYFPPGTWCNAQDPQLSYSTPWAFLIPAFTGLTRCLSRALFARGYREEVVCGYGFTGDAIQGGGTLAFNGEYWPAANFEISAVGLGASAVHDGLDWGYAMWNPESDQGDAELWELLEIGIPYLARRVKANTAGYGKYRGGSGWEALRVLVGNRDAELYMARADGITFAGSGIFGGYPQATSYRLWSRGSEIMDRVSKGQPYPLGDDPDTEEFEELVGGEVTRRPTAMMMPQIFHDRDVLHYVLSGGPGCGDPLERPAQRVVDDMNEGIFNERIARDVFGVVASRDEGQERCTLDEEATDARRQEIRRLRAERSLPYEEFWRRERQLVEQGQLAEPVRGMLRESMGLSQAWAQEFRAFWKLPEGFQP